MFDLFGKEKMGIFVGGIVVGVVGAQLAKTKKVRSCVVKGLAQGYMAKDSIMEEVTNIKEEAEDICNEAKAQAKSACNCECDCEVECEC